MYTYLFRRYDLLLYAQWLPDIALRDCRLEFRGIFLETRAFLTGLTNTGSYSLFFF